MKSEFKTKDKVYLLDVNVRNQVKPGWQEMLNPAKSRILKPNLTEFVGSIWSAERKLLEFDINLIAKDILEVGCNEGARCFLMAKYQDTYVHGIDVDEYTVDQSPDLNSWNPKDVDFVHSKFDEMRSELAKQFPSSITNKVTFETQDITEYISTNGIHDMVISWDTIEHIIDLPKAFKRMADCLFTGGISYHEYNPFFAINGGHSLCTLDFLYGHCRLDKVDFERYITENRQEEEKIDLNFYHKCLNRATMADVKKYAEDSGFEVLYLNGVSPFGRDTEKMCKRIEKEFLPEVIVNYPTVTIEDLLYSQVQLVLRKK